MFLKSASKPITVSLVSIFSFVSTVSGGVNGVHWENVSDQQAMFNWCKIERIKSKTKRIFKSIEKYKKGSVTLEEITLQISSLKRTARKAFKKNYNVRKIMEKANQRIDEFFQSLLNEESTNRGTSDEIKNSKIKNIISTYDCLSSEGSIKSFINLLEKNESDDLSEKSYEFQFSSMEEFLYLNYSENKVHKGQDTPEAKILFAYVSVFCGCLLCMIPTPFTRAAGSSLISGGFYVICEDKYDELDKNNKEDQEGGETK